MSSVNSLDSAQNRLGWRYHWAILIQRALVCGPLAPSSPAKRRRATKQTITKQPAELRDADRTDLGILAAVDTVDAELSALRAGADGIVRYRHAGLGGHPRPATRRIAQGRT